eukprot:909743_1
MNISICIQIRTEFIKNHGKRSHYVGVLGAILLQSERQLLLTKTNNNNTWNCPQNNSNSSFSFGTNNKSDHNTSNTNNNNNSWSLENNNKSGNNALNMNNNNNSFSWGNNSNTNNNNNGSHFAWGNNNSPLPSPSLLYSFVYFLCTVHHRIRI